VIDKPLIIAVAPNGAYKQREDHPGLPMTPGELADEALRCAEAGASMLHLHVRDAQGRHSLDVGRYREAMAAVSERAGERLLIQVTSESASCYTPEQQMKAMRELAPQAFSVALRELMPDAAHEMAGGEFIRDMLALGSSPQLILYGAEELQRCRQLQQCGCLPPQLPLLFVLGRYRPGQQSLPRDLLPFLRDDCRDGEWMLCAFGAGEFHCALSGALMGGHVRVGFENNLLSKRGDLAKDNAQLVAQMAEAADFIGRPLASAGQCREMLLVAG